ncbi:MAG: hypothetical protein IMW89_22095 [Ktedonobacteraceae bacterium]|nr:hypothetical protein [Ktedonobacteraceae bacterium]
MPKAKARKSQKGGARQSNAPAGSSSRNGRTIATGRSTRASQMQSLVMAAMVALGCWGLAISFTFFTADANRYLFGAMAALMALMWSVIFVVRLRRTLLRQQ